MENNEINLFELDELPRYVEIAYKKLKNSIFFDKSNVITRNDLVEFEYGDQWENKLKDLAASLTDSAKWESKEKEILESNGFSGNRRAEDFSIDEFMTLIKILKA